MRTGVVALRLASDTCGTPRSYSYVDIRGSYSIKSYKRAEIEFVSPRLFHRRGELSLLGGWRDATEVGFYGVGIDTSVNNRVNYGFERPYGGALLTVRPTRQLLLLRGGLDLSKWDLKSGTSGTSIEDVYTPRRCRASARPRPICTRRGLLDSTGGRPQATRAAAASMASPPTITAISDDLFGFRQLDYEVIQHVPILREAWVSRFTAWRKPRCCKGDQQVPFFMLPSLGGGSNLRGYSSWRFRDRNSVLLQAEWRIMVNRFFDTAVFYDAGKVAATSRT